MKTALDIADRNQTCAKAINYAIKKEIINMEAISKELGESRAAKFEKKIEKLSKAGRVHRIISNILHHKERDLNSIIKRQFTDLMSFTNFDDNSKPVVTKGSIIRGGIKNRQVLIDAAGGKKEAAKLAKDMGVSALKYKKYEKEAKKALKSAKKSGQELKDFVLGKK